MARSRILVALSPELEAASRNRFSASFRLLLTLSMSFSLATSSDRRVVMKAPVDVSVKDPSYQRRRAKSRGCCYRLLLDLRNLDRGLHPGLFDVLAHPQLHSWAVTVGEDRKRVG